MSTPDYFLWRRLHSLTGVVPIALFVLVHLFNNSYALLGEQAYDAHLEWLRGLPFITVFEWVFIYIPILFHGLLGLAMTRQGSVRLKSAPYFGNLRYILQRASGIGVFLFVGAHVYKTRMETWLHGEVADFQHMAEAFSEPITFVVYMAGLLAVAYHLGNGLWTFCITWGLTVSPQSQKVMTYISIFTFLAVWLLLVNTVLGFMGMGIPMVASTGSLSAG